jgi:hypothetical protein
VEGVRVAKSIRRQEFGARLPTCRSLAGSRAALGNFQDLWWNPAESGWGLNVAHQGDILFATLFTYGADGNGMWLVMSAGLRQADGSWLGDLYRTTGPAFDAQPFAPLAPSDVQRVGTMRLRFSNGENGTLEYSVDGTGVQKAITRQVFGAFPAACAS